MTLRSTLSCIIVIFLAACNTSRITETKEQTFALIPYPTHLTEGKGSFIITPSTKIVVKSNLFLKEAEMLSALFEHSFGSPLMPTIDQTKRSINLILDESIKEEEGYTLEITKNEVTLSAKTPTGMFRAVQTIRQLLPATIEASNGQMVKSFSLPAVKIQDEPAYEWRGMHLDVSRHFFSIDYLKKMLDLMAFYKFNKFHLHLTDDQGWRIEIKKYPLLTEQGAWRTFNNQDSACMSLAKENPDFIIDPKHIIQKDGKTLYGGFYTQEQMKDVVAYAAARHIDIIPEIDMPGHMMAAIDAYNYLSCDGKSAFGKLFSIPICPCLPATYQFAEDVYTEIMDIFPSKYLHIGGDEVERSFWAKSDACKELMAREGLKNTAELQSYFIHKMEAFFHSKGRELIGWDEILDGGISKTALIMYWRTWVPKAPIEAAKNGNKVIMTPGEPLYFDAYPDKSSLSRVYHFNPIPKGLTPQEAKGIIGAQANIWTETIPSENRAEYMMMPRMTALAEVVWTGKKDYPSFLQRLYNQYPRLDILNIHYRFPDLEGILDNYAFTDKMVFKVEKPLPDLILRYTTDSSLPTIQSKVLDDPLTIDKTERIRLAAFKPDGRRGDLYDISFHKESYAEPAAVASSQAGLNANWYKGFFRTTLKMPAGNGTGAEIVSNLAVPKKAESANFGIKFRGYIDIPETGIYTFYLGSDDGSTLKIADRMVVDNDGLHSFKEKNGQVALKKGLHPIALDLIEGGGGYRLSIQYSVNGSGRQDIPASWFKY